MEMLILTMMHVHCFEDFKVIVGIWKWFWNIGVLDLKLGTWKVGFVIFLDFKVMIYGF